MKRWVARTEVNILPNEQILKKLSDTSTENMHHAPLYMLLDCDGVDWQRKVQQGVDIITK